MMKWLVMKVIGWRVGALVKSGKLSAAHAKEILEGAQAIADAYWQAKMCQNVSTSYQMAPLPDSDADRSHTNIGRNKYNQKP